jgi:transcriptional regulator with XRE-family HTH domain
MGEGTLEMTDRIRLSRRHGGLSQAAHSDLVGVHRSAVSHWEAVHPKRPSIGHLLAAAAATRVRFEWLATGHGPMELDEEEDADIPALFGEPGIDPGERELLRAFRAASRQSRAVMLELAHQLATPDVHRRRMPPPRRCDFGLLPAEPLAAL